jgi:Kef-type K+ transport system membrane component KefB
MESALEIPLRDPVAVITLAMMLFLVVPLLFDRLRLPRVVGFIAADALFGPNGLGWLPQDQTIVLLGTAGLLYLMFIAAVEIDLHDFSRHRGAPTSCVAPMGLPRNGEPTYFLHDLP